MIIQTNGKICEGFYVTGPSIAPVYLLDGPAPVLFDAGFTALDPFYKKHIQDILGQRTPEYLFLTHSHFDHIGTASRMKKRWPMLKISGSEKCQKILAKESAVSLMRNLSHESTKNFKEAGFSTVCDESFEPFDIDFLIRHEQEISISPGLSILPIKTPGHTWDFISYWIPEKKILIASEAVAVQEKNDEIQTEFLVDADAYLESLEKMKDFDVRILCAGHYTVFTNQDAKDHITTSIKVTQAFLAMTENLLEKNNGDLDPVILKIKELEWAPRPWPKQSETAYLLNTYQRVKAVWRRMNP